MTTEFSQMSVKKENWIIRGVGAGLGAPLVEEADFVAGFDPRDCRLRRKPPGAYILTTHMTYGDEAVNQWGKNYEFSQISVKKEKWLIWGEGTGLGAPLVEEFDFQAGFNPRDCRLI